MWRCLWLGWRHKCLAHFQGVKWSSWWFLVQASFFVSISGHVYLNWLIILPFLAWNGQAGWWDGHKMPNDCNTWRTHGPRRVLSQSTGLLVEGRSTINQAWAAHGFTVSFELTTWTLRVDFQKEGQQEFWSAGFTGIMCYNSSLFMMVTSLFPIATTIAVGCRLWLTFLKSVFLCFFHSISSLMVQLMFLSSSSPQVRSSIRGRKRGHGRWRVSL